MSVQVDEVALQFPLGHNMISAFPSARADGERGTALYCTHVAAEIVLFNVAVSAY